MICENCFSDRFLSNEIKLKGNLLQGACQHCGANNVYAVAGQNLADLISPVLSLYIQTDDEGAKSLFEYFRRDWSLLTKPSDISCALILDEIFYGENISQKKFRSKQSQTSRLSLWDNFQDELKHINRFFPKTKIIDTEDLRNLFSFLILKSPPSNFYRARISDGKELFSLEQMGRPPARIAKGGRANPVGISYLYTASDEQTAISEVRPNVADKICVAKFSVNSSVTLLDLRNPRETISPFAIDADNLLKLLNDLEFLCHLGEQLSKAILPREADLEYLACQYLCEMVKHFNYDGVVYKSSVGPGFNVAFFDDSKVTAIEEVNLFSVAGVDYRAQVV
ncbi:RES family NAD+ phosphorylase [Bdellovibrio sp.]|uniref:RES family NAD+ phosphorylase n=1 Tax=Bdellovibrio sp. TaxID=28201 RepID=UPI0039E4D914